MTDGLATVFTLDHLAISDLADLIRFECGPAVRTFPLSDLQILLVPYIWCVAYGFPLLEEASST
ncbi:hypothetical protein EU546_02215 [Candidatus Thorarchaeota archaeon]|nr:MAG: hypothetical protein EU546_02215 [Candidatus Thorarchaeota archaeon]